MYKVKYASLNYYPDIFLISNIAVGVAFQVQEDGYYKNYFNIMPKKAKLFHFDDELDPTFTNLLLNGIKDNVINFKGELNDFTYHYVNNFKFTNIKEEEMKTLKEVKKFIDDTTRYILHPSMYDERKMSEEEKKEYINSYLKSNYSKVNKSYVIKGKSKNDKITVDFMAVDNDGNEFGYKIINNSNLAMFSIRSYLIHAISNEDNLIFILDDNMEEEKSYVNNFDKPFIKAIYKKDLVT